MSVNPVKIELVLETHDGVVVLSAYNNGIEVARAESLTVQGAVPALVSFFKTMQDATIDALYSSGLIHRSLDIVDVDTDKGLSS